MLRTDREGAPLDHRPTDPPESLRTGLRVPGLRGPHRSADRLPRAEPRRRRLGRAELAHAQRAPRARSARGIQETPRGRPRRLASSDGRGAGRSRRALRPGRAVLFPEGLEGAPDRFDPRLRMAADVYELAVVAGFESEDGSEVVPATGAFDLPFGRIDVSFDRAALRAGDRELYDFVPTAELEVRGLGMRYRRAGVGASLAAATRPIDTARPGLEMIAPRMKVQVTALLRIPQARRALVQSQPLTATLELHLAWDAESVSIAGEQVPLEADPTE